VKQDVEVIGQDAVCTSMDASLSIKGEADATGVTQFSNEACEAVEALQPYVESPYLVETPSLQDLKSYFQRPRLFATGSLTFASRTNVVVKDINSSFFTGTFPQWSQRLSGVYGTKFTLCFRLQVAATAFHQGVLALGFQYASPSGLLAYNFDRTSSSAAVTNLPHVRMDVSELTMVELKVPFLYPLEFYPVGFQDIVSAVFGHLGLNVVVPFISVTGLVAPSYKLYAWLEDMSFYGADNNASTTITLQAGVIEKELRESKLISTGLTVASRVVGAYGKYIPVFGTLAGPTAWALDVASGVAKYFGFARPLLQEPTMRVVKQMTAGEGRVDLPFSGYAVGPMQSNTLAFDGTVGKSDVDEMALQFVTSQFSQICAGQITTSNSHGTVVYATPISPSCFWFRAPSSAPYCNTLFPRNNVSLISQSGNSFLPSSVMNIASCFRLWRGDFIFRFTFAKTKFHGGRYMVSFNPSTTFLDTTTTPVATVNGPEVVSGLVQPYGYSMIMDMRDGNVFEFNVPFFCEQPYVNFLSVVGGLSIVCIDPLQANASVTTVVPFMVEVAGGENFELADYAGNYFVNNPIGNIYQQAGEITATGLNAAPPAALSSAAQHTIGERLTSIKQLIMIPSYTSSSQATSTTTDTTLPPWWYSSAPINLITTGLNSNPVNVAAVYSGSGQASAFLASMYAFVRGSTDYHVYMSSPSPYILAVVDQNPLECALGSVTYVDYQGRTNTNASPKVISYGDAPIHVRLPAFQTCIRIPTYLIRTLNVTRKLGSNGFSGFAFYFLGHFGRLLLQNASATNTVTAAIGCSAGDDATCSTYMGPEPVAIPNTLASNSLFPDFFGGYS